MDKSGKFLLPSPKFKNSEKAPSVVPHFLTPHGMMLPRDKQPPPMYGPRGSTYPAKFLPQPKQPIPNQPMEKTQKYFCEPCEAEFHTSTDYKVHKSEHVQCEIDKCSFRGHPAFMDTHITLQHATGIYDQLKKLNTPEEIAQWRAERKKNYPTVASVEQKWKAREQKMLRGEKLERIKNRFGRQSDRRQIKANNQGGMGDDKNKTESNKRQRKRKRNERTPQMPNKIEKVEVKEPIVEEESVEEEPTCGGLKMFKGTSTMTGYKKIKKVDKHALSSLLGMYGSGSESEDEDQSDNSAETVDSSKEAENKTEELAKEQSFSIETSIDDEPMPVSTESYADNTKVNESDGEAPDEAPIEKSSNIPDRIQSSPPQKKPKEPAPKKKSLKFGLDYRKLRTGRQNTMLEKLLEPDIRHERNVLLQCVRFVTENNFFGIGAASKSPSSN